MTVDAPFDWGAIPQSGTRFVMRLQYDEDLVDYDEGQLLVNDRPFDGIFFNTYTDGTLQYEIPYVNGWREGIRKEWYPNGQISLEAPLRRGSTTGKRQEWYESGALKSIGDYEYGVRLKYQEWAPDGELLLDQEIDTNSGLYRYVLLLREKDAKA